MKKRMLALLLALAMTVSLTACGGDAETSSSGTEPERPSYSSAEEAYEQAKACYDELSALSGDELMEAFQEKQAELNYDGNTDEFFVTPASSLVDGFSDAVLALDEYEIGLSGETSYGYFVVMRLPIGEETWAGIQEEVREDYVNDLFSARLNEEAEKAEVVEADALGQVDFTAYFEKLEALQELLDTKYDELAGEDGTVDLSDEELAQELLAAAPQEAREDCASYLTDGVLTNDAVVLTVNGEEITAATYLYFLNYNETNFMSTVAAYGSDVSLDDEFSEGTTYREAFVSLAKDYCIQYATAYNLAAADGVAPSEEQLTEIQDSLEEADEPSLLYVGCNVGAVEAVLRYGAYGDAYLEYLYGEDGVEDVSDEDVKEYAGQNGYYNCRYILFHVDATAGSGTDSGEDSSEGDTSSAQQ